MYANVLKFHIWIPHEKLGDPLSCCFIVHRIVYANVLKFHIWIPHEKLGDPCKFLLSKLSPFLELFPI